MPDALLHVYAFHMDRHISPCAVSFCANFTSLAANRHVGFYPIDSWLTRIVVAFKSEIQVFSSSFFADWLIFPSTPWHSDQKQLRNRHQTSCVGGWSASAGAACIPSTGFWSWSVSVSATDSPCSRFATTCLVAALLVVTGLKGHTISPTISQQVQRNFCNLLELRRDNLSLDTVLASSIKTVDFAV